MLLDIACVPIVYKTTHGSTPEIRTVTWVNRNNITHDICTMYVVNSFFYTIDILPSLMKIIINMHLILSLFSFILWFPCDFSQMFASVHSVIF